MVLAVASDEPEIAEKTPQEPTVAMAIPPFQPPQMVRVELNSMPAMPEWAASTPMKMNMGMALKL